MIHKCTTLLLLSILTASSLQAQSAPESPEALQQIIADRVAECASFENGVAEIPDNVVKRIDLTGDGIDDWVLDDFGMTCSTAASLFCGGTGGCNLTFLIGDVVTERLSKGWSVVDFGSIRTVLVQVHGANCGGTNLNSCVEAMVWEDAAQKFFTVAPLPD